MEKYFDMVKSNQYLVIPVKTKEEKVKVYLYADDTVITELNIPLGKSQDENYSYDYLAYLPMKEYCGKQIRIEGEVPQPFLNEVHLSDLVKKDREDRPVIHFTPDYGWINDPNGLVYHKGLYHLYFQYNPLDTEWDNMSWGHAVSEDLLHWEQRDTVLLPDEDGMIFSGCGLVNELELLGLPKDTLLFFYSAAGSANELSKGKDFVQKLAYSLDKGDTLIRKQAVLSTVCKENRDPKIFWHEKTKAYIMCLWLEKDEFAIFRSIDLENWEISQRLNLEQGFECPDLFELNVETEKNELGIREKKWVFWCADGYYYTGEFDGYEFLPDGTREEAYATKLPYAAQTISNLGEKVVSIPWLRTKTVDNLYTGCMGLPRELSLVRMDGKLLLKQSLIPSAKEKQKQVFEKKVNGKSAEISIIWNQESAVKIDITLNSSLAEKSLSFICKIMGVDIAYEALTHRLMIGENEVNIIKNTSDFCIVLDKGIIEITANNDIIYAVFEVAYKNQNREILIQSDSLDEIKIFEIQ